MSEIRRVVVKNGRIRCPERGEVSVSDCINCPGFIEKCEDFVICRDWWFKFKEVP